MLDRFLEMLSWDGFPIQCQCQSKQIYCTSALSFFY